MGDIVKVGQVWQHIATGVRGTVTIIEDDIVTIENTRTGAIAEPWRKTLEEEKYWLLLEDVDDASARLLERAPAKQGG